MLERTIPEVIDNEYREYSMYVLQQRAIPNVIDGLKPVQRKILYQLIHQFKTGKNKISEIGGSLSSINYHHGEAAAMAAAVKMGQDWDNNVCLLQSFGNFGTRLVHEAAAPRYIFGCLSTNYTKYFKDTDLTKRKKDPEDPEPQFYLPVIPWVLVNGIRGIAVGFACEYQPYKPEDLAKACHDYLSGKNIDKLELKPYYKNYGGSIKKNAEGQWTAYGKFEQDGQTVLVVTETTPSESVEGYMKFLDRLIEGNRISDYVDECKASKFRFTIKVTRAQRDWLLENPYKRLNLEETLNENLTSIDEEGNLKIFNSPIEIIKHFCEVRKKFYVTRTIVEAARAEQDLHVARVKLGFVYAVVEDRIKLKGRPRSALVAEIMAMSKCSQEVAEKCVSMNIYNLCQDEIERLEKEIEILEKRQTYWKTVKPVELFKDELVSLTK